MVKKSYSQSCVSLVFLFWSAFLCLGCLFRKSVWEWRYLYSCRLEINISVLLVASDWVPLQPLHPHSSLPPNPYTLFISHTHIPNKDSTSNPQSPKSHVRYMHEGKCMIQSVIFTYLKLRHFDSLNLKALTNKSLPHVS